MQINVAIIIIHYAFANDTVGDSGRCKIIDIFSILTINQKGKEGNYDKIKHLVEVDDDILTFFIA